MSLTTFLRKSRLRREPIACYVKHSFHGPSSRLFQFVVLMKFCDICGNVLQIVCTPMLRHVCDGCQHSTPLNSSSVLANASKRQSCNFHPSNLRLLRFDLGMPRKWHGCGECGQTQPHVCVDPILMSDEWPSSETDAKCLLLVCVQCGSIDQE